MFKVGDRVKLREFYASEVELLNPKVEMILNKTAECTCKSLDLFNFGCKCEYIKQK